jgi:hypothetical protein
LYLSPKYVILGPMNVLEGIFDSQHKAKLLKLFLFNPAQVFDAKTIATKVKGREKDIRRELSTLEKIRFVKNKETRNAANRKVSGWVSNPQFAHTEALREFLINVSPFTNEGLIKLFSKAGRIKLVVISGVFIHNFDARVDLLVVGDRIKKTIFDKTMRELEAEVGREIQYAMLESDDFEYRLGVGDKLVRDIFDYPHEVIHNKIGLVE